IMNSFARVLAMTAVLAPGVAAGAESARQLLSRLPRQLQLRQDGPRRYRFICDYLYTEPLGNPLWKERMSAEYTRTSAGGGARWSNVRIARAKGFEEPFPEGEVQPFMEGLVCARERERHAQAGVLPRVPRGRHEAEEPGLGHAHDRGLRLALLR